MQLNELGLYELSLLLGKGEVSPREIIADVLKAIRLRDESIKAYLEVYEEEMLQSDSKAQVRSAPSSSSYTGIPLAVKDNICIRGKRTTCASRILSNYVSPYSATIIERLESSGMIFSGKTNMDEFGMGSSTENSACHPTRNPWNVELTPGGSSGGSAAAVAADMAIAALGSDTGGSIRQPACFCAVVGLKPSYGRVSRYGLVAFASSFDQIGPITKNVRDAACLLEIIAGADDKDATTLSAPVGRLADSLEKGLEGLRVGVAQEILDGELDGEVKANLASLMKDLARAGVPLLEIDLPNLRYAVACYYIIANAEASSNLARYDGVKYGYRARDCKDLDSMYAHTRTAGFGEEVKRRIFLGTYVLSEGYYDEYYLKALKVRHLIEKDFVEAFKKCDLVLLPTSPTPPFNLGEKVNDPLMMYLSDVFTTPASLAGLPAISVPSGFTRDGKPLGVQLIGRYMDEETVLRGAYQIESMVDIKRKAFE